MRPGWDISITKKETSRHSDRRVALKWPPYISYCGHSVELISVWMKLSNELKLSNSVQPYLNFAMSLSWGEGLPSWWEKWRNLRSSSIINHFYFCVYLFWFISITLSRFQLHEPCYCFPRVKKTIPCLNHLAEEEVTVGD